MIACFMISLMSIRNRHFIYAIIISPYKENSWIFDSLCKRSLVKFLQTLWFKYMLICLKCVCQWPACCYTVSFRWYRSNCDSNCSSLNRKCDNWQWQQWIQKNDCVRSKYWQWGTFSTDRFPIIHWMWLYILIFQQRKNTSCNKACVKPKFLAAL